MILCTKNHLFNKLQGENIGSHLFKPFRASQILLTGILRLFYLYVSVLRDATKILERLYPRFILNLNSAASNKTVLFNTLFNITMLFNAVLLCQGAI